MGGACRSSCLSGALCCRSRGRRASPHVRKMIARTRLCGLGALRSGRQVCEMLRRRSQGGTWRHPNSGVFAGTVRGVHKLFRRLHKLAEEGHFEDQAMMGLAMLMDQHKRVRVDANATLFSSQYGYDPRLWQRAACFDDCACDSSNTFIPITIAWVHA